MFTPEDAAGGPQITPKTMKSPGKGGQAAPPYLQARTPSQVPTSPMQPTPFQPVLNRSPSAPGDPSATTYREPKGKPVQQGGGTLADVYKFFQSDLENQKNQALASTQADAAKRGVYYGTPLTGSEADINTQYLRGVGQLQAGMYGNAQQDMLSRLGMATQLMGQEAQFAPQAPGPLDLTSLGALFASRPGPTQGQPPITQAGKPNEPYQKPEERSGKGKTGVTNY